MDIERSGWDTYWQQLDRSNNPGRVRLETSETNRGGRINGHIVDSTAPLAVRVLKQGFMSGLTSPSRRWVRLTTPDPGMAEIGAVKQWLDTVNTRMENVFRLSNLYKNLPVLYGDAGVFGTAQV